MGKREIARGQPGDRHAAHGRPASYYHYTTSTAGGQSGWITCKTWADSYWPAVCDLMQRLGYGEPTPMGQAADWRGVDFTAGGFRWAWRNRSIAYLHYRDITVRAGRLTGAKTEADKLRSGAIDYCLWTWTDGRQIRAWLVLRVDRLLPLLDRDWPMLQMHDATAICIPFSALQRAGAIICRGGAIQ